MYNTYVILGVCTSLTSFFVTYNYLREIKVADFSMKMNKDIDYENDEKNNGKTNEDSSSANNDMNNPNNNNNNKNFTIDISDKIYSNISNNDNNINNDYSNSSYDENDLSYLKLRANSESELLHTVQTKNTANSSIDTTDSNSRKNSSNSNNNTKNNFANHVDDSDENSNNNKIETFELTNKSALESTRELFFSSTFWRFSALTLLLINLKTIFRHLDATLPTYLIRIFGNKVPKG